MKKTGFLQFYFFCISSCSYHIPLLNGVFHADDAHTGVYPIYPVENYKKLGSLRWKFKTEGKIFSSPVIQDGIAYIGSEDSNLYAIHAATGEFIWKFRTGGAVSSTPAVFNNIIYFTSYDGYCYAADAITGRKSGNLKLQERKK